MFCNCGTYYDVKWVVFLTIITSKSFSAKSVKLKKIITYPNVPFALFAARLLQLWSFHLTHAWPILIYLTHTQSIIAYFKPSLPNRLCALPHIISSPTFFVHPFTLFSLSQPLFSLSRCWSHLHHSSPTLPLFFRLTIFYYSFYHPLELHSPFLAVFLHSPSLFPLCVTLLHTLLSPFFTFHSAFSATFYPSPPTISFASK